MPSIEPPRARAWRGQKVGFPVRSAGGKPALPQFTNLRSDRRARCLRGRVRLRPVSFFIAYRALFPPSISRHPAGTLKLSVKSDYAARAVLALARRHGSEEVTRIDTIAVENGIPPSYLVQILIELKSGAIVKSVRGKAGGYLLARPPAQITFGDVLRSIHGQIFDSPAFTDTTCPPELQECWRRLRDAVEGEAAAINFQQILEASPGKHLMFDI